MRFIITIAVLTYTALGLMIVANLELYSRLKVCSDHSEEIAYNLWQRQCSDKAFAEKFCTRRKRV